MPHARKSIVITFSADAVLNDQVSFIDTDLNAVADQGKNAGDKYSKRCRDCNRSAAMGAQHLSPAASLPGGQTAD